METVHRSDIPLVIDLPARMEATARVEIRANVEGRLTEMLFKEGSLIQEGQLLFRIDPRRYNAAVHTAAAGVEKAEADLEMAHEQQHLVNAQSALRQAEANLLKANQDVERLTPLAARRAVPARDMDSAVATQSLALEPGEHKALDLRAEEAGIIRVTVIEQGTRKPLAGVRIWGFDKETGSGARFNAYTDEKGRARFYSVPAEIDLGIAGPPEGVYINGRINDSPDANNRIDFRGGEEEIILVLPPIAGRLVAVSGACWEGSG